MFKKPNITGLLLLLTLFIIPSAALELESANLNGMWTSKLSTPVLVFPHFYETQWFLILVPLIVLLASVLFVINRFHHITIAHKREITLMKLSNLQELLNPHFISNALMSIESLIGLNDERKTNAYISELYQLMRKMITYSGRDYVTVEEEMSFVRQYLKEEQLRIDFEFEIKCPYGLENFNIAPSFLQPLLENAIKHGVSALKDGKGFIRLSFLEHNENHLLCSVENKGPEFKEAGNQKKGTPKKIGGLDLINERFRVYNSLYKTNLGFIISNMEFEDNSRGVKVAIKIPAGKK